MSTHEKKVMNIGVVRELTGLSERQIRYYEEKKLLSPARTKGGTRKYSFEDIMRIRDIQAKMQEGFLIEDIRRMYSKKEKNTTNDRQ